MKPFLKTCFIKDPREDVVLWYMLDWDKEGWALEPVEEVVRVNGL